MKGTKKGCKLMPKENQLISWKNGTARVGRVINVVMKGAEMVGNAIIDNYHRKVPVRSDIGYGVWTLREID